MSGSPPTLSELLEESAAALARPFSAFERLAARPAPRPPVLLAASALACGLFLAFNLAHAYLGMPGLAIVREPGRALALAAVLWAALSALAVAAAAGVHALCLAAGGSGRFIRSFEIVAVGSALLPLQALFNFFPVLWPVPAALACAVGAAGAVHLHGARRGAAWAGFALASAAALSLQWAGRELLARRLGAGLLAEGPATASQPRADDSLEPARSRALQPLILGDMPLGPGPGGPAAPAEAPEEAEAPMSLEDSRRALSSMLDQHPAMRLAESPELLKKMPPENAKLIRELAAVLRRMQKRMGSETPLTDEEMGRFQREFQKLTMETMRLVQQPPREKK